MSSFRRRNEAFFKNNSSDGGGVGVETNSLVTILRHARKTGSLSITGKDLSAIPMELFSNELAEGEKFWECEPITQLDLSFNRIKEVGPQMAGFAEAQLMKFRSNEIAEFSSDVFHHCNALKHLDLGLNNLSRLDVSINLLAELRVLLLPENDLTSLPETLRECLNLQELDVHKNRLKSLPELDMPQLRKLRCSKNELTSLPFGLSSCTKLEQLDCAANRIRSVPSLESLECLKVLNAMDNALKRCPELPVVSRLEGIGSGLEFLNLAFNELTLVPPSLILHEKLSEVHLQNNKLAVLDAAFAEMTSLKLLDLSNNSLQDVPYELGYCVPLVSLLIDGNPIRSIRRTLITRQGSNSTEALKEFLRTRGEPPRKQEGPSKAVSSRGGRAGDEGSVLPAGLDLRIRDVPDRGGHLDLKNCSLAPLMPRALFEELFRSNVVNSLTCIDVSNNGLTMVPLDLPLTPTSAPLGTLIFRKNALGEGLDGGMRLRWSPPSLTSLDVSANGLSTSQLDTLLSDTPSLCFLEASSNKLDAWPTQLASIHSMREVRLCNNRLTSLSGWEPANLQVLEILDLSGNALTELPGEEFEPLLKLSMLDLSNNDIAKPPYQLGFLPQLERLNLQGNPTRTIRQALVLGPTGKLKEYLRNRAPAL